MSAALILATAEGTPRHTETYQTVERAYSAQALALRDLRRGAADLYVLSSQPGMPGYAVARRDIRTALVRAAALAEAAPAPEHEPFDARRRACGDD